MKVETTGTQEASEEEITIPQKPYRPIDPNNLPELGAPLSTRVGNLITDEKKKD